MGNFYSESNNKYISAVHALFYSAFKLSPTFAKRAKNAGEIADFSLWIKQLFHEPSFYSTREKLWAEMLNRITDRSLTVVELGVAWGYTTNWWLSKVTKQNLSWHGFDLFTGLPSDWRGLGKGHFDADGQTPNIEDPRITWHVGFVEERIKDLSPSEIIDNQIIILFDLDLFEPSYSAWNYLKQYLKPGDLLYFDEAFDQGERKLLEEFVLPSFEVKLIGNSPLTMALEITRKK